MRVPRKGIAGALTRVRVEADDLHIRGWAASPAADPITGFRVACRRVDLPHVSWRHRASDAHFTILVRLPGETKVSTRGSLISVTPLFGGRGRWSMFAIPRPGMPLPSRRDWSLVGGSFLPEACLGLELLVNAAHLKPDERILDIGSGVGRMAYVLSHYLSAAGRYEGLEPVRRWIRWSRAIIGARHSNFRFAEFPVRNALYNPGGRLAAGRVRFPVPDSSFDVALATSVFQHNDAIVAHNYLREAARVLRPGGRFLITCFLLRRDPQQSERRELQFTHALKDCWTANRSLPETGIAFRYDDFRGWALAAGFSIARRFHGTWHGESAAGPFQDVVVLRKNRSDPR